MTRYTEMFDVTIDLDITKIDVPEDAIDDAISDIRGVVIANGAWGNKTRPPGGCRAHLGGRGSRLHRP